MRSTLLARGTACLALVASLTASVVAQDAAGKRPPAADAPLSRASFTVEGWDAERSLERALTTAIAKDSIREFHERLASEPNLAGTRRARMTAEWMMGRFAAFGMSASLAEYEVLLAEPVDAVVEIVTPERVTLPVRERTLDADPKTAIAEREIGWNAFSGSGDATGPVVYANYGRKEDFERLGAMGVDLRGAVVIARYGGNFRGFKAKFAEEAGAAALIIYTDPADAGRGPAYPDGVWANGSTIQRGSIITNEHRGDPLTPGWASARGAKRLEIEEAGLPTIPVQPIGWDAAREILSRMKGSAAPEEWKGGLDAPYALTGGDGLTVRVKVAQARARKPIVNVLGMLEGAERPDELVIIGCHYDSWVYGAWDPASGMSVVMELARVFGEAAQRGERPKRSILFVGWDAEEFGLMGSTEWVEHHAANLARNAVAYINLDAAVSGDRFGASAWPSLKTIIAEAAAAVPAVLAVSPDDPVGASVLDQWISAQGGTDLTPRLGEMGGGSDHSAFLFHVGVPSASAGVSGAPPANYHSVYDSLHWFQNFVLTDYEPSAKLARVVAVQAARLANADLIPLDHGRTLADFRAQLRALTQRAQDRGVALDAAALHDRAEFLEARWRQAIGAVRDALAAGTISEARMESVNGLLRVLDRAWITSPRDSEGRWHRNLYIGPDDDSGYAAWPLPPLRRAVEAGDEEAAAAALARYSKAFDQLGALFMALELAARPE